MTTIVADIVVTEHRVVIKIAAAFSDYFKEDFWFSCDAVDLRTVPHAILLTPFILNIAPVIWACNLKAVLPCIDATLSASLVALKKQYQALYPTLSWSGEIDTTDIVNTNKTELDTQCVALLFSAGVDSVNLSQDYLHKHQILLTVRGADVKLDDDAGWEEVKSAVKRYASPINATSVTIESNFVDFINYNLLSKRFFSIREWWGFVQHGIGLAGFLAIPAYAFKPDKCLMASDVSTQQMAGLQWASVEMIMSRLVLPISTFSHEGYAVTRQEKINRLSTKYRTHNELIPVRVCYSARGGKNCGKCRKCLLAMLGFLVSGQDYQPFGFATPHATFAKLVKKVLFTHKHHLTPIASVLWVDLQNHILPREKYEGLYLPQKLIDIVIWLQGINIKVVSSKSRCYYFIQHVLFYLARQVHFLLRLRQFIKRNHT